MHIEHNDTQMISMKKTKDICSNILKDNQEADSVDFANYLDKISNMEQEGYQFMNEHMKEKKFNLQLAFF